MRRFLTASRSSSPPRKAPETEKGQVASSSTSAAHAASLQPSDETQDSSSCGSGSDLPPPPTSSTPQPVGFRWVEKEGDLFQADTSLAHCVSADLRLGKGIAQQFRRRFQGIQELQAQPHGCGMVPYLRRDRRYIFNLVTKAKYWEKPTYQSLSEALITLRQTMEHLGVQSVAIPQIGCGLDRLEWHRVKDLIHDVFQDARDVTITVYSLPRKQERLKDHD